MRDRSTRTALVKMAALAVVVGGPGFGCGGTAQGTDPGTDPNPEMTGTSEEAIVAPPAGDCGGLDTSACKITSAFTPNTYNSLASALAVVPNGDVLTIRGTCQGATVQGRTGLTFQGPIPIGGCGVTGPSPTLLKGQVKGLRVLNSTNISVRFLNLVNSTDDGLFIDHSRTPLVSCVCAAHNASGGISLNETNAVVVSQSLSEGNGVGIELNQASTVILSNNTVKANTGNGIAVKNSTSDNVSFNVVTGNGGFGLYFENVTSSLASGNTLANNALGSVRCVHSQVFGACF